MVHVSLPSKKIKKGTVSSSLKKIESPSFLNKNTDLKSLKQTVSQLMMELRQVENELSDFREVFHASAEPILMTNTKIEIVYVNPAWENLTGYTFEEVRGLHPRFLRSKKTAIKVHQNMWKVLFSGKSITTEDLVNRKKDGTEYPSHSTFFPVKRNGQIIYYVQLQHDISKRVEMETLKKGFLSMAAHELKTPITTLKLISQSHISKYKRYGYEQIRLDELELIDRELERLTQLINDILDDTRAETGKLCLNLEQTNLKKLFSIVVKKMTILSHKHRIIFHKPPGKLTVVVDQQRIEQVLINLISNAIKYSESGTKIEVGAKIEKKKVLFWVSDEGIGIPDSFKERIFDRFFQIDQTKPVGFGLGLYITKQIIELHKGKIWVESNLKKGSTFYFSLPLIKI